MEVLTIMNSRRMGNMNSGRAQKGAALVVGLLLITVMSMIGVSGAKGNIRQQRMANNYRFSIEAMNNAEIGIANALNAINDQELVADGFDDELDPNGDGNVDDSFRLIMASPDRNVFYNVVIVDDDDGDGNPAVDAHGVVRLMSQGISNVGSTRTVDVRIGAAVGVGGLPIQLDGAILTEGDLTISGNTDLSGSNQGIHSNSAVNISGNPDTDGNISAVGSVDVSGNPSGEFTIESGADYVDIPEVNPSDFAEYADLIFHSDGEIYDADGVFVADAFGIEYQGWMFNGEKWTTEGNNVVGGFLYFRGEHGKVVIGSNPGSAANPWEISILADGYIEVSGNPKLTNYADPDDPPEIQTIMFMSGSDIKINGNASQEYSGIIAAAEQIDVSGNPSIEGVLIAADQSNDSDLVLENSISGVTLLAYDGGLVFPSNGGAGNDIAIMLSWRDRDIARNTGVFSPEGQGEGY